MNKFIQSVHKRKDYLWLICLVTAVFSVVLIVNGCWPYGESTIVVGDSYSQIGLLFERVFDWLSGGFSAYYTPYGFGMELLSTIEYMFLNPFYLVVLIFGKNNIFISLNMAVYLMLMFNAVVFMWFSKTHFKNLTTVSRLIFAMLFTFSTYLCFNIAFVSWIILPAILLIVVHEFLNMTKGNHFVKFALALFWFVVTSISIGISANIVLVLLFSGYIFIVKEKQEQKTIFTRLFAGYIVAIILAVIVLFPSIIATTKTARSSLGMVLLISNISLSNVAEGLCVFAVDSVMVLLAVCHLVRENKKDKFNKFSAFALIILSVPLVFNGCLNLLNMGTFFGFIARFYLLNQVWLFIFLQKVFNESGYETQPQKGNIWAKICYGALALFGVIIFVAHVVNYKKVSLEVSPYISDSNAELVFAAVFLWVLISVTLLVLGKKFRWFSTKLVKIASYFLMIFSMVFNCLILTYNTSTKDDKFLSAKQFMSSQNITEGTKLFNINFDGVAGYNLIELGETTSVFTSMLSKDHIYSLRKLGYDTGLVNIDMSGGNLISDSLLGLKYYLSDEKQDRPYLKLIAEQNGFYLYENTLATTGAVVFDESFKYQSNLSVFDNFENLKNSYGVQGKLATTVEPCVEIINANYKEIKTIKKYTFTAETDGVLYVNAVLEKLDAKSTTKTELNYIASASDYAQGDVVYLSAGETISFSLMFESAEKTDVKFSFINYETAKNLCLKMQENSLKISNTKKGYVISGEVSLNGNLFISKITNKNLVLKSNDKNIEQQNIFYEFSSIKVQSGTVKVEASYSSMSQSLLWIAVALIGIVFASLIIVLQKTNRLTVLQTAIYHGFRVLNYSILLIFYIFGIILSVFVILL